MGLQQLNEQVTQDLSYIGLSDKEWVQPKTHAAGHVYDVVIVGGGQSGLCSAFALLRERISNILVLDENPEGTEGPWVTYARMYTLRTPKQLPSIDLGVPSLTFQAWYRAQHGTEGWDSLDKIPRVEWMNYLKWYRHVLQLPVRNEVKLDLIEPTGDAVHKLHVTVKGEKQLILARKVVLATGIQGGGEWHVPDFIKALPKSLYAHTAETIDFDQLKGKRIGILGGGASAFDNANYALDAGVAEAHVFVRRKHLPRVNPIRQLEHSGIIERFHKLSDIEKYTAISHFFKFNQPPTNDTFLRAASFEGFHLHNDSPWLSVEENKGGVTVTTPHATFEFDYLIISTGLISDSRLRPELRLINEHVTRWEDVVQVPADIQNNLVDAHPYLTSEFAFVPNSEAGASVVRGIFSFNYAALVSCGVSASALSGIRFAIPKLIKGIADELFEEDKDVILTNFLTYDVEEFVADLEIRKKKDETVVPVA
ncbi:MAG: NAD(P)/FAD-dependent oxidoreductase [Solibacillus sp.]